MSDHLDVLDQHLDTLEELNTVIQRYAKELPEVLRKARARIRALRREQEGQEPCQTTS